MCFAPLRHAIAARILHTSALLHLRTSAPQGFGVAAVLPFVLPLCSSASDKTREAALSLLREAYIANPAMLTYAKASLPEAVLIIQRLREKTDGEASPKKEKPSLAQFKQTHEPFARKQALPDISSAGAATGVTGATELAVAGRGDFINITNVSKPRKTRAPPGGPEGLQRGGSHTQTLSPPTKESETEINDLLQECGLE